MAPIDGGAHRELSDFVYWHGRVMVFAWSVLFPIGILAARFFKIMPNQDWPREVDNKTWWHTHLTTQYSGGVIVLIGLALVLFAPDNAGVTAWWHTILGWAVVSMAAVQFAGGWLRGTTGGPTKRTPDGSTFGDHYNMTSRRKAFEAIHKSVGYLAVVTSVAALLSGLFFVGAPLWMLMIVIAWWLCLAALFVTLQCRGFRRDTYQAIWGPDPKHPGNSEP
ncbi:MAG: cytochrome b561 domain-containing protein [Geminicoccaceae bacterium]